MRKLIAGMKLSLDGKTEGPECMADWVDAWSEDYGLTPRIGACLLGGGMYPGYERYWSSIQAEPDKPAWINGAPPTTAELEWAEFIKQTPHYVLSTTLDTAAWPNTRFVRSPRRWRTQDAVRKGHLPRWRRPRDGRPDRCRIGR